jgi:dTDP-4-dehydrorhamnose 3,5-epimerase
LIRKETGFDGLIIIEPDVHEDCRGWFMESYSLIKMREIGIDTVFVQDNHSYSNSRGVVRGLHFQDPPMDQIKLVRCSRGSILDVSVDIRKGSPRYGKWFAIELSAINRKQIFIPSGYAHGFVSLEDDTEVQYKVDRFYSRENERTIRYDDPEIGIDWGVCDPIVSEKDSIAPNLDGVKNNMKFSKYD